MYALSNNSVIGRVVAVKDGEGEDAGIVASIVMEECLPPFNKKGGTFLLNCKNSATRRLAESAKKLKKGQIVSAQASRDVGREDIYDVFSLHNVKGEYVAGDYSYQFISSRKCLLKRYGQIVRIVNL